MSISRSIPSKRECGCLGPVLHGWQPTMSATVCKLQYAPLCGKPTSLIHYLVWRGGKYGVRRKFSKEGIEENGERHEGILSRYSH